MVDNFEKYCLNVYNCDIFVICFVVNCIKEVIGLWKMLVSYSIEIIQINLVINLFFVVNLKLGVDCYFLFIINVL